MRRYSPYRIFLIDLSILGVIVGSFLFVFGTWLLTFYYNVPLSSRVAFVLGDSLFFMIGIGLAAVSIRTFGRAKMESSEIIPERSSNIPAK